MLRLWDSGTKWREDIEMGTSFEKDSVKNTVYANTGLDCCGGFALRKWDICINMEK